MSKAEELSKWIVDNRDRLSEMLVREQINGLWRDATKLLQNIYDTSTGDADREKRLIEFEKKFGLPTAYIHQICKK